MKKPPTCKKCYKVCYRDELEAKMALAVRVWKDKGEIRAYRCGRVWHLTSEPLAVDNRELSLV